MKTMTNVFIKMISGMLFSSCVQAQIHHSPILNESRKPTANDNAATACWSNEINPATNSPYTDFETWNHDVNLWIAQKPTEDRSLSELTQLYIVMNDEKLPLSRISYDKVKHSYIGCRIAVRINRDTSYYAAWQKEQMDLSDCKLSTHFEPKDYEATIKGADFGSAEVAPKPYTTAESQKACLDFSNASFPRKHFRK